MKAQLSVGGVGLAQIEASTKDIEDLLIRLDDLVLSGGGVIHEDARLVERSGAFSIEAPATIGPRQPLIEIPGALLLPVAWFDLSLSGDDIQIGTPDARASLLQTELMETLVALYNATGKVRHHRETSTYSIYETDFELFAKLAFPDQIRARESVSGEEGLLRDFLRTRVLGVPQSVLGINEPGVPRQAVDVLMPIIDFLNHHPRAGGYNIVGDKLIAVRGHPTEGSEECFICYGRHDAQSLLFTYGFLERSLPFAFSVPLTLDAQPGGSAIGKLVIHRSGAAPRAANIPPRFQDSRWILPALSHSADEKLFQLSYLPIVPATHAKGQGQAPLTRRLLELAVVALMGEDAGDREIAAEVARLERAIVEDNMAHYGSLKETVAAREHAPAAALAIEAASRMIDMQLSILTTYARPHSQTKA